MFNKRTLLFSSANILGFFLIISMAFADTNKVEGKWILESIKSELVPEAVSLTIEFTENQITGLSGCNQYFGSYSIENENISIGEISSTRKYCGRRLYELEVEYFSGLREANFYKIEDEKLIVFKEKDCPYLLFQKVAL